MNSYKYSELSETAKKVARDNYLKGWNETHPNETYTEEELDSLCTDIDDEMNYNEDGTDFVE